MCHKLHFLGIINYYWDRVHGLCSETWKGCELVDLLVVLRCLRVIGIKSLTS